MRTVAVVTSSRADYSHLVWVLREIQAHPHLRLQLIVMAAHLSPEFGCTEGQIRADGFAVARRIECLLSSDRDVGMAKTIGLATLGLADAFDSLRPDLLLLIADRYEMLAPASAALTLRIPIAHIEGGELSEGAIDQQVRNALTMMSHVHFATTRRARARILSMGEEPWRVHCTGAPSLDALRLASLPARPQVESLLGLDSGVEPLVVAYHPLTIAADTTREMGALFEALRATVHPIVFCFPNADAGSRRIIAEAERFGAARDDARVFVNLEPTLYWGLLRCAAALVGNSSSGIMEAGSLSLPAVNIGLRQHGRERAAHVIDVAPRGDAILGGIARALDPAFRASLAGMSNPYGDGHASERIVRVLAEVPLGERLLRKSPQMTEAVR